jgi:hypothetical protein
MTDADILLFNVTAIHIYTVTCEIQQVKNLKVHALKIKLKLKCHFTLFYQNIKS